MCAFFSSVISICYVASLCHSLLGAMWVIVTIMRSVSLEHQWLEIYNFYLFTWYFLDLIKLISCLKYWPSAVDDRLYLPLMLVDVEATFSKCAVVMSFVWPCGCYCYWLRSGNLVSFSDELEPNAFIFFSLPSHQKSFCRY